MVDENKKIGQIKARDICIGIFILLITILLFDFVMSIVDIKAVEKCATNTNDYKWCYEKIYEQHN